MGRQRSNEGQARSAELGGKPQRVAAELALPHCDCCLLPCELGGSADLRPSPPPSTLEDSEVLRIS